MSEIVSKFYTLNEKLGLKKHKFSETEGNFLDRFEKLEKIKLMIDEDDYNFKRVRIKFHVAINIAIFLVITALFIVTVNWVYAIALLVISAIVAIISRRLKDRADIIFISKCWMLAARQIHIDDLVR